VQQVAERDEFLRHHAAATQLTQATHPAEQLCIELGLAAEVTVNAAAAFDHPGQDVVDVLDRKSVVHAVLGHRTLGADRRTMPAFTRGIAFTTEQHHLAMPATGQ